MQSRSFIDCLALFNRKERYWLLKNALGVGKDLHLPLSDGFWKRVKSYGEFPPGLKAKDIWWAMDYHFDWIAGAVRLFRNEAVSEPLALDGKLITGTQEDVDLLLAYGNKLLLIEAKVDSQFDSDQFERKIKRFKALEKYAKGDVEFKWLYMTAKSKNLKLDGEKTPHCHLEILPPRRSPKDFFPKSVGTFCRAARCNAGTESLESEIKEKNSGTYTHWKIETVFKYEKP